jgi:hypothetical protein
VSVTSGENARETMSIGPLKRDEEYTCWYRPSPEPGPKGIALKVACGRFSARMVGKSTDVRSMDRRFPPME